MTSHLAVAQVSGFTTQAMTMLIYFGSFLWCAGLITTDSRMLASREWERLDSLLGTLIGLNALSFLFQTIDALYFHMKLWPITALLWTCQLAAIALSTAGLAYALCATFPDDQVAPRHSLLFSRVVAQCVYTGAQFSVALEYLHRTAAKVWEPMCIKSLPVITLTSSSGADSLARREVERKARM